MLLSPNQAKREKDDQQTSISDWMFRTSRKMIAIGAGMRVFLRRVEKMAFSLKPTHTPDPQFIDELVSVLSKTK